MALAWFLRVLDLRAGTSQSLAFLLRDSFEMLNLSVRRFPIRENVPTSAPTSFKLTHITPEECGLMVWLESGASAWEARFYQTKIVSWQIKGDREIGSQPRHAFEIMHPCDLISSHCVA